MGRILVSLGIAPPVRPLFNQQCGGSKPVSAHFLHQFLDMHDQYVAVGQIHDVERPAAPDRAVDDLIHLGRSRNPFLHNPDRFADIVAENIISGEGGHVGG